MRKLTATILLLSLALPALTLAQAATPAPRPARPSQPPGGASSGRTLAPPAAPSELDRNITIAVYGQFAGGSPIDFSLTGCGREFVTNFVMGSSEIAGNAVPNIGSVQFLVTQRGEDYLIEYSIGARLAIATSTTKKGSGDKVGTSTTQIGFEDVMLTGTVRCQLGKDVQIFKAGAQELTLKLGAP